MDYLTNLVALPQRLDNLVSKIDRGELITRSPETEKRIKRLESSLRRVIGEVFFIGTLIGGLMLKNSGQEIGAFLMGASAIPLVYALGLFRIR